VRGRTPERGLNSLRKIVGAAAVLALAEIGDEEDTRLRLRSLLRRITDLVWVLFVGDGAVRAAAVSVVFKSDAHISDQAIAGGVLRPDYVVIPRMYCSKIQFCLAQTQAGPVDCGGNSTASVCYGNAGRPHTPHIPP